MVDLTDEIRKFGNELVSEIKSNLRREGNFATGKTEDSLKVEAAETRLIIYALNHIVTLEDGRGPTRSGSGRGELKQRIREWILAKGITPEQGTSVDTLAFLIARKIHREGTRLYRRGGNSGVLRSVLNDARFEQFADKVAETSATAIESDVLRELELI